MLPIFPLRWYSNCMARMQLTHVYGSTYVISAPTSVGLVKDGRDAYLIDAGNNRETGRQIRRLLDDEGLKLRTIINTHSHADHIGGNRYLQEQTGCSIAAPARESVMVESPRLEGEFLWGGGIHPGLSHPLVLAAASVVNNRYPEGAIAGTPLEAVSLPGHSIDMMGIKTLDGIFFTADTLMSRHILDTYPLFYLYHLGEHLNSLQKLASSSASLYVPSHAPPTDDPDELIRMNRSAIEHTLDLIVNLAERKSLEELLTAVCDTLGIRLNHIQYVLTRCTISAYLGYAMEQQLLTLSYINNRPVLESLVN